MCSICASWGYILANAMYAVQKLASCCALTAVVCCMVLTMIVMLGVGIGLGYHYCVVQGKTYKLDLKDFQEKYDTMTESIAVTLNAEVNNPSNSSTQVGQATTSPEQRRMARSDLKYYTSTESTESVTELNILIQPTMELPIEDHNLPFLLLKLRSLKKNVTLKLFTT